MQTFADVNNYGELSSITLTAKWQKLALAYNIRIGLTESSGEERKQTNRREVLN